MYIDTDNPEVDKLFSFYSCICTNHKIGYFSTPISTGIRYYNWLKSNNINADDANTYSDNFKNDVFMPNIDGAMSVVNNIVVNGNIIVNPVSVGLLPGWKQEDYINFWRRVIESNIDYVVFNDEWYYSDGCVYEFYVAKYNNKKCYNINNQEIALCDGINLIKCANEHIKSMGFKSYIIDNIISELEQLNKQ